MSETEHRFQFGDRVRHARRPEWGIGSVIKAEDTTVNGKPFQRISVRFPNVGVKRLISGHALVHRVENDEPKAPAENNGSRIESWDRLRESGWLSPIAERKVHETMTELSEEIRDPFNSLAKRLAATLALYRFDRSGRGLIDWAVAQSGLKDPLSRFTRQELEQMFDRWARHRDEHLEKLLQSAQSEPQMLREVLDRAPRAAREAARRLLALR